MSPTEDLSALDALIDEAFSRINEVGNDPSMLEEPFKTIVIITAAQGQIDNGGLRSFFECDWPGTPSYSLFVDAYERIECPNEASCIRHAVDSFGLDSPEIHAAERNAYMEAHFDEKSQSVAGWEASVCGNPEVWSSLLRWALKNGASLGT
ncbi:MAG: hypothetical protein ACI8QS_001887 [Planctomycetota bacterium]|jgi:hypothetical protein